MATTGKWWAKGLIQDISKGLTENVISTNIAVVIKDKYPKARHHFLVLPLEDIDSIFELTRNHLDLLAELKLLALNAIEIVGGDTNRFKVGFHAQPSMQRLHVHVISIDFISPALKTKKHWNSFNSKWFIPFDDALEQIKQDGKISRLDKETLKILIATPLKCNQCNLEPKNMIDLKNHLLTHLNK